MKNTAVLLIGLLLTVNIFAMPLDSMIVNSKVKSDFELLINEEFNKLADSARFYRDSVEWFNDYTDNRFIAFNRETVKMKEWFKHVSERSNLQISKRGRLLSNYFITTMCRNGNDTDDTSTHLNLIFEDKVTYRKADGFTDTTFISNDMGGLFNYLCSSQTENKIYLAGCFAYNSTMIKSYIRHIKGKSNTPRIYVDSEPDEIARTVFNEMIGYMEELIIDDSKYFNISINVNYIRFQLLFTSYNN